MRFAACILLLLTLLAGCMGGDDIDADDTAPGSGGADGGDARPGDDGAGGHELHLVVAPLANRSMRIDVPLPTGMYCLAATDFTIEQGPGGLRGEIVATPRGQILRVSGPPTGDVKATADLAGRPPCTAGDDLWSIDPDPAIGSIDVEADQDMDLRVFLVEDQGSCHTMTVFGGLVHQGWSSIEGSQESACA